MMMSAHKSAKQTKAPQSGAIPPGRSEAGRGEKRTISATRRWLLISRNVYDRAQQRGFVGGDPLEDLSDAIREVDEEYATDISGLLSLTDPAELVEQFRNLFAGYGLGKGSLDRMLEKNRDALEKLAIANRARKNGKGERASRRASLLRNAADEAIQNLQTMAEGAMEIERRAKLPGQPTHALVNLLNRLSSLAESAGELAGNGVAEEAGERASSPQELEIHGAVVRAYDGMSPAQLAQAPVDALKGLSQARAAQLEAAFGMVTIRDMAGSRLLEKAAGIVDLADEEEDSGGGSLSKMADGPVSGLEGVSARQARVLGKALRIRTIRDLAGNRFFRLARAIVTLADLEA